MKYRLDTRSGNELSILGFGCMRFPRTRTAQIDMAKTEKLIMDAIKSGINYFDTAYIYFGSEEALGTILHKNNARKDVFIATKLPLAKCKKTEDFDTIFNEQLEHLKTDYIDYYFMHNLSDTALWKRLCDLGIEEWIKKKKLEGKIKQVGFSFHGTQDEFLSLLDSYDWDFCQIQLNYVNTTYQAGLTGLQKAAGKEIPIMIMEPLLGGKLATGLPQKAVDLFKAAKPNATPAEWALNWLWNQKEVCVVLSGMNSDAQLEENVKLADKATVDMLSKSDLDVIDKAIVAFNSAYKIGCTGCNYCMPCPHNVNIPACFTAYNMSFVLGRFSGFHLYVTSTGVTNPSKNYGASNCKKCGKCEKHCPQSIKIIQSLEEVSKKMEPFWFKSIIKIINKIRG